ncbi:hypothetical protein AERO9A_110092 [Aeromonas salmonicida]|nr:hypothetical protein AERO9A_110092 [Aeromonas salmonicida]
MAGIPLRLQAFICGRADRASRGIP